MNMGKVKNKSLKKQISLSPSIIERAQKMADRDFSGNLSALFTYAFLHLDKCDACPYYVGAINNNTIKIDGDNSGNVIQGGKKPSKKQ